MGAGTVRPVWLALLAGKLFLREKVMEEGLVVIRERAAVFSGGGGDSKRIPSDDNALGSPTQS